MKGKIDTKWIIIIIALLGVFAVIAPELMAISGSGYTVNSVSVDTPIITDSTNLKNVKYIIGTTFNGRGQSIDARITPSDIQQLSGQRSLYDFAITVDAIDETITYPINNYGNKITQFSRQTFPAGGCTAGATYTLAYYSDTWYGTKKHTNDVCIYETTDAVMGRIGAGQVADSARITISSKNGAETYSKTIHTETSRDVFFKDSAGYDIASMHWGGSLVTGFSPPEASKYVVTYTKPETVWTLSHEEEYYAYTTQEAVFRADMNRIKTGQTVCGSLADCENMIGASMSAVEGKRRILVGGTTPTIGGAPVSYINRNSEGSGKLSIRMDDKQVNYMTVNMMVTADWIGIVIPSGVPDALSVNCPTFASGDSNGLCTINIKNTGNAAGTFGTAMNQCGVFSQLGATNYKTFAPGNTDSMNVYIGHGASAAPSTQTCTFTVTDTNSGASDTIQGTVSMTEPKACVAGAVRKAGAVVYQCNADGTGEDVILACGADDFVLLDNNNNWYCEERVGSDIPGLPTLDDINDFFNEYGTMLSIIFIVIGFIALMLVFLIVKMYVKNLIGIK